MILSRSNSNQVELDNVFYVPGMTKNLVSVSQLTSSGNFVVFGPNDVKVYHNLKTQKNETSNLWHATLGHVSYCKLKTIINKSMLKGLPQLDIGEDKMYLAPSSNLQSVEYMVTFIDDFSRNVIFDEASSWWAPESEKSTNNEKSFKEESKEEISQTFSPVAKLTTVRVLLALAAIASADSSLFVKAQDSKVAIILVYVDDIIITGDHIEEKYGISDCKPIFTPMEVNKKFCMHEGKNLADQTMYCQLVGRLIYLTLTRSDISYSVRVEIMIHDDQLLEAEYRATAMAAQENMWIKQLMKDLHQEINHAETLYYDNLSAIHLVESPIFHARTNHVEGHYHFIKEKVLQEEIEMKPIKAKDQVADIFTKGLPVTKHTKFLQQLGMVERPTRIVSVEGEC
ncbi:putative mitochondrial protein [Cucumis melo var. makuwa]|uniref:Mitochondrial protein n=1 Tax=Cucumis melo var. makuwa TaxID=1194695 RepID=A0A5A7USL7_CUCMM|nr:putative mitochondrial protein [Cucumis melo var. makuwa]TYK27462.1 putative mitochondrial protein [Cucumis melo var. makuwa]